MCIMSGQSLPLSYALSGSEIQHRRVGGGECYTKWASKGEIRKEKQCHSNCNSCPVNSYNLDFIIQNTNGNYIIATNNATSG